MRLSSSISPTIGFTEESDAYYSNFFMSPGEEREEDWDMVIRNDAFTAGMPLNLLEITGKTAGDQLYYNERWEPYWRTYYLTKDIVRAGTSIGAVLSGPARLNDSYLYAFSVILTPKGAEALGLKLPNPEYTNVWLSGNPTPEEEERITEQISQIALRGRMSIENRLLQNREYAVLPRAPPNSSFRMVLTIVFGAVRNSPVSVSLASPVLYRYS